jgi:hypothetical protein
MRTKIIASILALFCVIAYPLPEAKADGGAIAAAATVGFLGGALIGSYASPYYYGPYGYAPVYYHAIPYGYVPTYSYSAPYAVAAPCWDRRLPVYDRFGEVVAIRYEHACR